MTMMKMVACLKLTYLVTIAVLLMHSPCILTDGRIAFPAGNVGAFEVSGRKQQEERKGTIPQAQAGKPAHKREGAQAAE